MKFKIGCKAKTFRMKGIPFKVMAERFPDYKTEGRVEMAFKSCQMKRLMKKAIDRRDDASAIADLAELALD